MNFFATVVPQLLLLGSADCWISEAGVIAIDVRACTGVVGEEGPVGAGQVVKMAAGC